MRGQPRARPGEQDGRWKDGTKQAAGLVDKPLDKMGCAVGPSRPAAAGRAPHGSRSEGAHRQSTPDYPVSACQAGLGKDDRTMCEVLAGRIGRRVQEICH